MEEKKHKNNKNKESNFNFKMEGNQPTQEQSPNQPLTEQQVQEQLTTFLNDPAQREKARIQCAFLYQVFKDKEFSVQALPVIFQCSIKHAYDVIVVLRSFGYAKLIKDHKKRRPLKSASSSSFSKEESKRAKTHTQISFHH